VSAVALGEALLEMVPREVAGTVYDGQAPVSGGGEMLPTPPWVVVNLRLPDVVDRSMAGPVHASEALLRLTATAGTVQGVRMILDDLLTLEGQRPVVEGWSCGPLRQVNIREPQVDRDYVFAGALLHPVYAVLEFAATVTRRIGGG